jgi:hypothetical protein
MIPIRKKYISTHQYKGKLCNNMNATNNNYLFKEIISSVFIPCEKQGVIAGHLDEFFFHHKIMLELVA